MKKILFLNLLALATSSAFCANEPLTDEDLYGVTMCKCAPNCGCNHHAKHNHNKKERLAEQKKPEKLGFWASFVKKMNIKNQR